MGIDNVERRNGDRSRSLERSLDEKFERLKTILDVIETNMAYEDKSGLGDLDSADDPNWVGTLDCGREQGRELIVFDRGSLWWTRKGVVLVTDWKNPKEPREYGRYIKKMLPQDWEIFSQTTDLEVFEGQVVEFAIDKGWK